MTDEVRPYIDGDEVCEYWQISWSDKFDENWVFNYIQGVENLAKRHKYHGLKSGHSDAQSLAAIVTIAQKLRAAIHDRDQLRAVYYAFQLAEWRGREQLVDDELRTLTKGKRCLNNKGNAKLTESEKEAIRNNPDNLTQTLLADKYHVCVRTIQRTQNG